VYGAYLRSAHHKSQATKHAQWRRSDKAQQRRCASAPRRCYTANQLAEAFEGKAGLGGERTIRERVSALATQGFIKFFRNSKAYGLPLLGRSKFGYLCV